jgi:hypothetical protein
LGHHLAQAFLAQLLAGFFVSGADAGQLQGQAPGSRKWPLPQAGSSTRIASNAASFSCCVVALLSRSAITGKRADTINSCTS